MLCSVSEALEIPEIGRGPSQVALKVYVIMDDGILSHQHHIKYTKYMHTIGSAHIN